ncbi:SIR2 family protein [Vibrio agarivorans]|uniref:SIR2 family protein n=1 Tax=Vibrio agarivorans TaxID=153622 RepID=A0ABT7XXD5_9VIBR|nr:SIR2 family protein [Vibrio agarivorans]MDN2480449.1 SIR2 family protein [Vibrio agarivorans]
MAKKIGFAPKDDNFKDYFARIFQSSNINFILGAGASNPAIIVAGDIENQIQSLYNEDKIEEAKRKEYDFILQVQQPTNSLIYTGDIPRPPPISSVLTNYEKFIANIGEMLGRRRNNLLPKKVNIFTTNYDLFIEKAALSYKNIILNDGFKVKSSLSEYEYDTRCFSRISYEASSLYDYKVEIPSINLIKMHGSMSWKISNSNRSNEKLVYEVEPKTLLQGKDLSIEQIEKELENYHLIFPKKEKFKTVLLNHTYYDLMRIYSNELDKEQTTLIAFGFSFLDEHIQELTKRALRNSTLKLVIFAYSNSDKESLEKIFDRDNNVDIVFGLADDKLDFAKFNEALECYLPLEVAQ